MKHHGYKEDIHESSSEEEEDEDGGSSEEENHEGSSKENEDLYGIPVNLSEVKSQILAGATSFERPDDDSIVGKQLSHMIDALKASFAGSGKAEIMVPLIIMHQVRRDNSLDDSDTDSKFDFERIPRRIFWESLNWLRQLIDSGPGNSELPETQSESGASP
uniref:Uncharacterized protein n=1 Tax=Moniliophthora roreri TaxID=221103 RepID=A0A0W0G8S6_MONRR